MHVDHHELHHDFPEFKTRIEKLRRTDRRFAKLLDEYNTVDLEIRRIEESDVLIGDAEMEKLKWDRVHLKDKLYARLTEG